ncbi:iron complex transport system substrate-binding protein [Novosphingobium hassiacum]|uniref:Iron complex transport system substrate-binding protein n=1 Tax=Novosphingobium hassiacum TaxID=173676 RepID=A0A7W6EVS1_9SPHN|nr:GxxExxY protein [Novosphingobium hassiacum]MBB3860255.1 iron complex transport system substrate-binding protein [Novosphingobium hassiacum]
MEIDEVSAAVIDVAIGIHRDVGPGLFESVYEAVLAGRLEQRGLHVERQVAVGVSLDGHFYDAAFRIDLMVERQLIVEVKAIEQLSKAHAKQLLTYLRLMNQPVGLLLNFSGATMKEGIRRMVNNYRPDQISAISASSAPLRETL